MLVALFIAAFALSPAALAKTKSPPKPPVSPKPPVVIAPKSTGSFNYTALVGTW